MFHLFDGKSSSRRGGQFIFAPCTPLSTFEPQGETMIAIVLEDTPKFGRWTRMARLLATAPKLLELCQQALELEDEDTPFAQELADAISRVEDEWEYDPWGEEVKVDSAA